MEYRRLATTDLMISRIGFGCWAIGGHGYGYVDDKETVRAIRTALDCGVTFFDTADVYGLGHSEIMLAKALGKNKNDVVIATKVGVKWDEQGRTSRDLSPGYITKSLENSLRRLQLDCIPLYQIHWPDDKTHIEDTMTALLKCRDAGKIKHIGCCNFSYELILNALDVSRLGSIQYEYNVVNRTYEDSIARASSELGMSALVYSVIGRGLLSAKYNTHKPSGKNDTRERDPEFSGDKYQKNIMVANLMKKISNKYNMTPAQVAIRWVLQNQHVACAIVGCKTSDQVTENCGAIGWNLDCEDMEELNMSAKQSNQLNLI